MYNNPLTLIIAHHQTSLNFLNKVWIISTQPTSIYQATRYPSTRAHRVSHTLTSPQPIIQTVAVFQQPRQVPSTRPILSQNHHLCLQNYQTISSTPTTASKVKMFTPVNLIPTLRMLWRGPIHTKATLETNHHTHVMEQSRLTLSTIN